MWFPSWLRNQQRSPFVNKRPTFRPTLEALEDRWVPSTLTVRNNFDSGAGSLRAAIASAHNGDTINFAPSLDGQTITLTSGEILIKHSVTITGFADRNVTISGNNASRVFELFSSTKPTVTLGGLTISDGYANGPNLDDVVGGGILNQGALTVSNCTLSHNFAGQGSAIHNDGPLTITGSTLSTNSGNTGVIQNYSTATVSDSTFSDNTDTGIWNDGTLSVTGSILSGNFIGISNLGTATATLNGCTLSGNYGRAIDNSGSAALKLSNSTLSNNSSRNYGGGIYVSGGTVTVSGCTLTANVAGSAGGSIYSGGGIYVSGGTVTVSSCTLTGNSAPNAGGGIYVGGGTVTLTNDTMTSNTATNYGGGLYITSGATVSLDAFTVADILNNTDSSGLNGPTANIDGSYTLL